MKRLPVILLAALVLSVSCAPETESFAEEPQSAPGTMLSHTFRGTVTVSDARRICDSIPQSLIYSRAEVFKLRYCTTYLNRRVVGEAMVLFPLDADDICLAEYFHSGIKPRTPFSEPYVLSDFVPAHISSAPEDINKEIRRCVLPLAASGYCVVVPDYIGYGETSSLEHPFLYYPEMFKANRDALYAAREFLVEEKGFDPGKDVVLYGWSEGAGACLSAHRYLEEYCADDFNVVASSCLAGPYDLENLMLDFFTHKGKATSEISQYLWAAYSINKFAPELGRPGDQIFSIPVYDQASAFQPLPLSPGKAFRPFFSSGIESGDDSVFRSVVKDISCCSWTPSADTYIYLHHGTSDSVVPYFNSVNASEGLKAAGSGHVELLSYQALDHSGFLGKFGLNTLREFNALVK